MRRYIDKTFAIHSVHHISLLILGYMKKKRYTNIRLRFYMIT